MDLGAIDLFDVLVFLALFAAFILGYIQGTIRRLLGIASILFAFLLASNLRDSFGGWLADNWTQFPRSYSLLIAYATLFVVFAAIFSIVIQGFYKRTHIYAQWPIVDEIAGGVLGVVEAIIVLGIVIVILDTFPFQSTPPFAGELGFVRSLFQAVDGSTTQAVFRGTLLPAFFALAGGLVPKDVASIYRT